MLAQFEGKFVYLSVNATQMQTQTKMMENIVEIKKS